jgi:hypothetical protein
LVIARLEARRIKLRITDPRTECWLGSLRERAKLLRLAIDEIEQRPDVVASCLHLGPAHTVVPLESSFAFRDRD